MKFFLSDLLEYGRFYILAFTVLVLVIGHTINGQWAGDFWEHSAVVSELTVTMLLTHPITFILLAAGVLSLSITNLSLLRSGIWATSQFILSGYGLKCFVAILPRHPIFLL